MVRIPTLALKALAALVAAAVPALAVATPPSPLLTVITDASVKLDSYSAFWNSLKSRGYDVTFRTVQETEPALQLYDDLLFDHLLLFAPTAKSFPSDLSPQALFSYLSAARNLFIILDPSLTEYWRDFSREFDIDFDDRLHRAIDHFAYEPSLDLDGTHTSIIVPLSDAPEPFVSAATKAGAPVVYRGAAHEVGKNPLLASVLRAGPTAYSYDPATADQPTDDLFLTGSRLGLVSAFQAKNNARVTVVGSADLFSDEFAAASVQYKGVQYPKSGNEAFIKDITSWAFQESGVLHATHPHLRRAKDQVKKSLYRVKDELELSLEVSTLEEGVWKPYTPDSLQFEFTMLDPHLRLPLPPSRSPSSNSTLLSTKFVAPDRHGVFTLLVDYRRPGYTWLKLKEVVSVTPPRHDEYERYIFGALPYYTGAGSVMLASVGFIVLWTLQ